MQNEAKKSFIPLPHSASIIHHFAFTMTPLLVAIILFGLGGALLVAEMFVPGGVLGALGGLMVVGAVVTCFFVNQWLGVGSMGAMIVLGPLAWAGWVRAMQKTRL